MRPLARSTVSRLRTALFAVALLFAAQAQAGPPLLCHPFAIGDAASLPWGKGWNQPAAGYDRSALTADTLRLLQSRTPVLVRMETLRRAAIYAGGDGRALRALGAALDERVAAASEPDALALFDAGYFAETLQDLERLQGYDMPGVGRVDIAALRTHLRHHDGNARLRQALALRPRDAAMHFAAALVAAADERKDDYARHARIARAASGTDGLLAMNVGHVAD